MDWTPGDMSGYDVIDQKTLRVKLKNTVFMTNRFRRLSTFINSNCVAKNALGLRITQLIILAGLLPLGPTKLYPRCVWLVGWTAWLGML
jgi:hypothetical protein